MPLAIGIDLGTVNSCVAIYQHGSVEIIANHQGDRITPSVVAFTDHSRFVGEAAKLQADQNTQNTIYDAKRLIGKKFGEIDENDLSHWPFKVVNRADKPKFEVTLSSGIKTYSPKQISAAVLIEMKETAEAYLGEAVKDAVITVPAHFNNAQREATKDAAEIAGLNVLQLLNEPTAVAVAYGLKQKLQKNQNILVFDMGGGTFDVSILTIDKNDVYQVRAVGGDTHLGGEDFNNRMLDHFATELSQKHGLDVKSDKRAMARLLRQCEKAKIALSTHLVADVQVVGLMEGFDFASSITRANFEGLNGNFFVKALEIVEDTIVQAKLSKSDIHEVVLVGGSTFIPKVQKMLQNCFNGKKLNKTIKPDEAVAYGAAVYASVLSGEDDDEFEVVVLDVTPHTLGIEHSKYLFYDVIPRNTVIPAKVTAKKYFSNARDNQSSVAIKVYEGERMLARENKLLGQFLLNGFPESPARTLKISVTLEVDVNGILTVNALETTNSISNSLTVECYETRFGVGPEELVSDFNATEDDARVKLIKYVATVKPFEEKLHPGVFFTMGMLLYRKKSYTDAFINLTLALFDDDSNNVAMEHRALIHFEKEEYEECVIECEEILKTSTSKDVELLKQRAKKKIPAEKAWHEILQVAPTASTEEVETSFRSIARLLSPNARHNRRLLRVDQIKVQQKMARLNKAMNLFGRSK